jgi:protease YdgD
MVGKLTRCVMAAALNMFVSAVAAADVTGSTHREPVDVSAYPWSAIGKLFNEAGGACTGVIVARDKILTAAHCVFNERTRRFVPASSLHFMVGYRRGQSAVHARVAWYEIGSGYDPRRWSETMDSDWVILTLTDSLPQEIEPLTLRREPAPRGTRAIIAGYPQDRAHMMTADRNCHLGEGGEGRLVFHTCRGSRGYSGAPILVSSPENEIQIAGIHIAMTNGASPKMIAVPAQAISREGKLKAGEGEAKARTAVSMGAAEVPRVARTQIAWVLADRFDVVWQQRLDLVP